MSSPLPVKAREADSPCPISDLEQAVESLAELLEKPLEDEKIAELRQQTTDKTVYVQRRCQILLEDTLRGYEEERWIWADPITM